MISPWPRLFMDDKQYKRARMLAKHGYRVEFFGQSAHGPWSAIVYAWEAGQFLEKARMVMRDMDELLTWAEARVSLLEVRSHG